MFKLFRASIITTVAAFVFVLPVAAQSSLMGEVVDVIDGRTIVIALPTGRVNVQLQFIDVPESQQEFHETVKNHLRELLLGKIVEYRPRSILRTRTIGLVKVNSVDISQQMIRDGAAWHTPIKLSGQDLGESELYSSVEAAAKRDHLGIWTAPNLKPAWQIEAERLTAENSAKAKQAQPAPSANQTPKIKAKPPTGVWADKNPKLTNIGPLANGYNAATKRGYLSTTLLGISNDKDAPADSRMGLDITYLYQEKEKGGRKGVFVVNILSVSKEFQFLKDNDLILMIDGKKTVIPKPRRTTTSDGELVSENLSYTVQRSSIYGVVNGNDVELKVGKHLLRPAAGLQLLLFNMLQISE